MKFGEALEAVKEGQQAARQGWNGKGMYIYFVGANRYAAQTDVARANFGDTVPYRAYIAFKTVDNDVVPWVASQTDILADDWYVFNSVSAA